ncbi:MAG: hypothetical protein RJA34_599 [Pseudomonadota bacterium]|jgi:response regulator RpfG family c-di-GMP phosphodiesterase
MLTPAAKNPWKILLVDDEEDVIEVTRLVLEDLRFDDRPLNILDARSAQEARLLFEQHKDIAVAFIDVVMETEHAGLDLVKYVREQLGNRDTRLILRTGNPGAAPQREIVQYFEIDDYKEKTELTADRLEASVYTSLRGYRNLMSNIALRQEVTDAQAEVLNRLCAAIETRSKETGTHIRRIALYSRQLGTLLGLPAEQLDLLEAGAPMHDIGKVATPDHILNKPGPLTEDEWDVMRRHPEEGYRLLTDTHFPVMQAGADIARSHHEKWNGSGYPHGLAGEAIPLFGRIVALVDVFDAMLSKRAYKEAWSLERVAADLQALRGSHFDPRLTDLFLNHLELFHNIYSSHPD